MRKGRKGIFVRYSAQLNLQKTEMSALRALGASATFAQPLRPLRPLR